MLPFVKWVGGKRQLIAEINKRMPSSYNNYFEPFVGGGALFMSLENEKTYINDASSELINVYEVIRDFPYELMSNLDELEINHEQNPEEHFYSIRKLDREDNFDELDSIFKAARFIYLNKTCFNGLYRVNKKGQFNVPFNKKQTVNTYDKENILSLSEYLNNNCEIHNDSFEEICIKAKKGDFIFFDPPYDLLKSDTFESYTKEGFGVEGQKKLANLAEELVNRGCHVMLTNHNTDLINKLYSERGFKIDVVQVKRNVNRNGNARSGEETIIYKYAN